MVPAELNRMKFFERIANLPAGDLLEIQGAYWLAKNAHRPEQPRDNGERVFEHPRGVAWTLIERNYIWRSILVKAFCHDVVEDTNTPTNVIVKLCGYETWKSLVTLSKRVPVFNPVTGQLMGRYEKPQAVYFDEIAKASEEDRLVKLADRLHNMSTMEAWEPERRKGYAMETKTWLIPIAEATDQWFAEQLGESIKKELE
jgi:(p)ppGpp synthase/HD superfamily hydrolase